MTFKFQVICQKDNFELYISNFRRSSFLKQLFEEIATQSGSLFELTKTTSLEQKIGYAVIVFCGLRIINENAQK